MTAPPNPYAPAIKIDKKCLTYIEEIFHYSTHKLEDIPEYNPKQCLSRSNSNSRKVSDSTKSNSNKRYNSSRGNKAVDNLLLDNSSDNDIKKIIKNLNDEKISHRCSYKMKTHNSNKGRVKNNNKVYINNIRIQLY
jgi:hypothetical protein